MSFNVKVTIIMPFLNSIDYLKECMDSVVNQTLKEIEILCIDAGSTDGTVEMLEEYAKKDSRIKLIHSDKKSYGYQVNLGLDQAKGEYFGIVESDDYIKENMYEVLYSLAKKHNCEIVKSDFCRFVNENGERKIFYAKVMPIAKLNNIVINPQKELQAFRGYVLNQIGIYSMELVRKNHIRLNETPGASYQDNGLRFQLFSVAQSVFFYNKAFYMLRRDNPNSSIHNKGKVYAMCYEYDFIRDFLKTRPDLEARLAPVCAYFRYRSYDFTISRISDEFKYEFIQRFSEDFKKIKAAGELDEKWFNEGQLKKLTLIMNNPEKFYFTKVYKFEYKTAPTVEEIAKQNIALSYQLEAMNKKIDQMVKRDGKDNQKLQHDLNSIKNSWSFKIGRMITFIPRKVRGGIRCYKEHGLRYTANRLLFHLKIR